jgi:hypothetical protein
MVLQQLLNRTCQLGLRVQGIIGGVDYAAACVYASVSTTDPSSAVARAIPHTIDAYQVAREEGVCMSVGGQSACAPNAVDVRGQIDWEIVVDNVRQLAHIQAPCSHVGGHHHL